MDFVTTTSLENIHDLQNAIGSIIEVIICDLHEDGCIFSPEDPASASICTISGKIDDDAGDQHFKRMSAGVDLLDMKEIVEHWTITCTWPKTLVTYCFELFKKRLAILKRTLFALICSHRQISTTQDRYRRKNLLPREFLYRVTTPAHGPTALNGRDYDSHTLSTSPSDIVMSVTVQLLNIPITMANDDSSSFGPCIPVKFQLQMSPFDECLVLHRGGEDPYLARVLEHPFFAQQEKDTAASTDSFPNSSSSAILLRKRNKKKDSLSYRVSRLRDCILEDSNDG